MSSNSCWKCGFEINPGDSVCKNCGYELKNNSQESVQQKSENLDKKLRKMKINAGIMTREDCSDDENKQFAGAVKDGSLPDGVYQVSYSGEPADKFYRLHDSGLTGQDLMDYFQLKQLDILEKQSKSIDSIKGMVTFFVVLTVLSLLGSFITLMNISRIF